MKKRMKDVAFEFYKKGHPFSQGIHENEINTLVQKLKLRLPYLEVDLDLSPKSLEKLYKMLIHYHKLIHSKCNYFSEVENLEVVREIVAYLGQVTLNNKGGVWDNPAGLLEVGIRFDGAFEVIKENKLRKHTTRVENLGYLAADIWDGAIMGTNIDIMKSYNSLAQKRIKEKL